MREAAPFGRGGVGPCQQPKAVAASGLPCSSCACRRPLRQCHTAARVTAWPTTTREGKRLPEGSMALGPEASGRAGGAALGTLLEAGSPLPSLPEGGPGGAWD